MYGGKGWIGGMLKEYLEMKGHEVILSPYRVDAEDAILKELLRIQPDRLICVTGRTHGKIGDEEIGNIDYLEREGKLVENVRDNLYGPVSLALIAQEQNLHLTYFGTGCIFDGFNNFRESDLPNFFGSSYSVVKGFTDRLMHFFENSVLNLRIRMPIVGHHNSRNFITKILNYKQISSIPNSMTVLEDMIPIIEDMILNMTTGTINLVNPGLISHNDILMLYQKYVDPSIRWENVSQGDLKVGGRSNNSLDTSKLQRMYPKVPNIYKSVERLIKNWNL